MVAISVTDALNREVMSQKIDFRQKILLLQDIGPESPANNRIRTIRELADVVLKKKLEEVKNQPPPPPSPNGQK